MTALKDLTRGFDSSICQENELVLLKRVQIPVVKSFTSAAKDSIPMEVCILAGKGLVKLFQFESSNIFKSISKHHESQVCSDCVAFCMCLHIFTVPFQRCSFLLSGQKNLGSDSGAGQAADVSGCDRM